ncbi:hypothetical protein BK702_10685 [Bacillus thuringiensis serovar cameroun]|nr:hypothetical protein BK702_10685 [Bacillus thuringiensis serovar cameroun]
MLFYFPFEKGKVTGKLGNVTDTEWHTVVFHAKIKLGQFGKTITNTAEVTGEGISRQTPKTDVSVGPEKLADKPVIDPIKDTDKEITGTGTPGDEIIVKDPTQTIDPLRILPSTGGQFSIALYAGGLLLVIGLLFLVRSKRKNN